MCKFCDAFTDRTKDVTWLVRNLSADDNVHEVIESVEELTYFELYGYKSEEGNTMIGVSFYQEVTDKNKKKLVVHPFSETIRFNFCPICGKQLSKNILDPSDYYEHQISISDREV